jgi:hypothetical protein
MQSDYAGQQPLDTEVDASAINADYYDIKDVHAYRVAGLLVLKDAQTKPVRAELHVYDDLPSHIHEGAVRQARLLLQGHYGGGSVVPVRIMQTRQMRDAVDVKLDEEVVDDGPKRKVRLPVWGIVGAVAAAVLIALGALAFQTGQRVSAGDMSVMEGATRAVQAKAEAAMALFNDDRADSATLEPIVLPASVNARSDLALGTRVAIVPGLRLTLRSEPGAEAGVPVGYMMDEDTALIVGGPEMTAGTSDTIVWWLVNLDDGTEAWAAANTSDQTLLIPADDPASAPQ